VVVSTPHDDLPWDELKPLIDQLWLACQRIDCARAREVLLHSMVGYTPTKEVEDLVWRQRNFGTRATAGGNVTQLEPRRAVPQAERPN
jgi:hypothetical protein